MWTTFCRDRMDESISGIVTHCWTRLLFELVAKQLAEVVSWWTFFSALKVAVLNIAKKDNFVTKFHTKKENVELHDFVQNVKSCNWNTHEHFQMYSTMFLGSNNFWEEPKYQFWITFSSSRWRQPVNVSSPWSTVTTCLLPSKGSARETRRLLSGSSVVLISMSSSVFLFTWSWMSSFLSSWHLMRPFRYSCQGSTDSYLRDPIADLVWRHHCMPLNRNISTFTLAHSWG